MSNNMEEANMTPKAKRALVPALRFPEFRDAGEWERLPLETMCSLITKGTTPTTLGFQYVDHGINFIKIESIDPNKSIDCNKIAYISDECNKALKRSQLEANDILFSIAGALGVVTIVPSYLLPANTNQALAIIRVKPQYSLHYLMNFLNSDLIQLKISKIKAGAAQPNISLSQLGNFQILMPDLFEQQKIADCLSSVDELITLQARKIDALKSHKKGLMQQLFPAEGETLPKLRFPEFRDAGEWEEKKLGDLSQILRGGSPRPIEDYLTSDVNGLNWLKIGDVDQSSKYITHTSEKVIMSALGKTREVNPGDLIMSNSMSFGRPYILKIKTCIHDGWIVVTNIVERIVVDYLYYLFLSPASKLYFLNNAAGAVVQNLNADIVKLLPVCLPSFEEQQKIADCLSSVDDLIALEARKIDALKSHKKGLMQQLFPSLGEVRA